MTNNPKIFWVIGDGTDVGKSTFAVSLIKALNEAGVPSVGFKPHAWALLQNILDFMVEVQPRLPCAAIGPDALKLALASPLTNASHADLVGPVYSFCYSRWREVIFTRTGTAALGNVEYCGSLPLNKLKLRKDFIAIVEKARLPILGLPASEKLGFGFAPRTANEKVRQAFSQLQTLGAEAIVCEGGSMYLPVWEETQIVNHVLLIADGFVNYFPDIDLPVHRSSDNALQRLGSNFIPEDRLRRRVSAPFPLTPSALREAAALKTVKMLLERAERQL